MKKLAAFTTIILSGLLAGGTVHADGVELDLSGHAKMYSAFHTQEDNTADGLEARHFDILRETELHFTGRTTLDTGLAAGVHLELDLDGTTSSAEIRDDESYLYLSGDWGRINLGRKDGAAFLLQVTTPGADSNVDGLRPYINPVNYATLIPLGSATTALGANTEDTNVRFSYGTDVTGKNNKLTYLSPILYGGAQFGVSYTPELGDEANGLDGVNLDGETNGFGDGLDFGLRYEGNIDDIGIKAGAGYSFVQIETAGPNTANTSTDDRQAWNVGIDLDWKAFGFGVSYSEDDYGDQRNTTNTGEIDPERIWVIGAEYKIGDYKLGVSYYNADSSFGIDGFETERYMAGIIYSYAPGISLRGSVHHIEHDNLDNPDGTASTISDAAATSLLLGTQINF